MNKFQVFRATCILGVCVAASAVLAAPPSIQPGSWTLAILPDTQYYTKSHPHVFNAQTQFLADNKTSLNIAYVLHEGDIVHDNNSIQWTRASTAFQTLDDAGVPYSLAVGNHDCGPKGRCADRTSLMSDFFPVTRLAGQPTFGGVYPGEPNSPHNSYSLFSAGGKDWLVLALEFGSRDQIVDWADDVLKQYPNRQAMIVTHTYLSRNSTRHNWPAHSTSQAATSSYPSSLNDEPGGFNDGEEMWTQLKDNPNLQFVFCGHICGTGYLASEADHGNIVHQMLADYQDRSTGGEGYLRLLEFLPDGRTVRVRTYSPHLDRSLTGADNDFMLTMISAPEPSSPLLAATDIVFMHRHRGVFRRPGVLRRRATHRSICTN